MEFDLENEPNTKAIKHNFFKKIKAGTEKIIIKNAYKTNYSNGWHNYSPFESKDGTNWTRTKPGKFNGEDFFFNIKEESQFVCWYPPYKVENFNSETNNPSENVLIFGDVSLPKIVFLAGQHPGESMSFYFLEGIIKAINEKPEILNKFSFAIFPTVNYEGLKSNNHRLTPQGIDLNRSWFNNQKELNFIKKEMNNFDKITALIDVHGDEVTKKDFMIYNKNYKGSLLENTISNMDFIQIKRHSLLRRFLKNLIRNKKIKFGKNNTARDYFESKNILSITMELSAHINTPQMCIDKGYNFISNIGNDNVSKQKILSEKIKTKE